MTVFKVTQPKTQQVPRSPRYSSGYEPVAAGEDFWLREGPARCNGRRHDYDLTAEEFCPKHHPNLYAIGTAKHRSDRP